MLQWLIDAIEMLKAICKMILLILLAILVAIVGYNLLIQMFNLWSQP